MIMEDLIKEAIQTIRMGENITGNDMEAVAKVIERCEQSREQSTYFAAGYLRGVAEANDVTLLEMLENL
jgi:hypothetical protein